MYINIGANAIADTGRTFMLIVHIGYLEYIQGHKYVVGVRYN